MKSKSVLFITKFMIFALLLQACGLPSFGSNPEPTVVIATEPPLVATQPPAQPAIVHSVIPNAGSTQVSNAHDNEESTTFEEKSVRGGDDFRNNRFERPFTSVDMAYLPHIDIVAC